MKKTNLILIIARKGSKDNISRQNLRLVNEKPLIHYIINTAKNVNLQIFLYLQNLKNYTKLHY